MASADSWKYVTSAPPIVPVMLADRDRSERWAGNRRSEDLKIWNSGAVQPGSWTGIVDLNRGGLDIVDLNGGLEIVDLNGGGHCRSEDLKIWNSGAARSGSWTGIVDLNRGALEIVDLNGGLEIADLKI